MDTRVRQPQLDAVLTYSRPLFRAMEGNALTDRAILILTNVPSLRLI